MSRVTRSLPALALLALLSPGPAAAQPQETTAKTSVRIVGAKATGKLKKGEKPATDPKLKRYAPVFSKLGYDRYAPTKGSDVKSGASKAKHTFNKLPVGHVAIVTCQPAKKGKRLLVSVTVTRKAVPPEKVDVKVASMKVHVNDGGHFLIKCAKVYPDGDLLLVVTASTKTLTK